MLPFLPKRRPAPKSRQRSKPKKAAKSIRPKKGKVAARKPAKKKAKSRNIDSLETYVGEHFAKRRSKKSDKSRKYPKRKVTTKRGTRKTIGAGTFHQTYSVSSRQDAFHKFCDQFTGNTSIMLKLVYEDSDGMEHSRSTRVGRADDPDTILESFRAMLREYSKLKDIALVTDVVADVWDKIQPGWGKPRTAKKKTKRKRTAKRESSRVNKQTRTRKAAKPRVRRGGHRKSARR